MTSSPLARHTDEPSVVDVRTLPGWSQDQRTLTTRHGTVTTWQEPVLPGRECFDAAGSTVVGDRTRLWAIDAAVNVADPAGRTNARCAIATVGDALAADPAPADAVLARCAATLHQPGRLRQRNPQVCVAVVDVTAEEVRCWRAGDCELWARRNGRWRNVFPGSIWTAAGDATYRAAKAASAAKTGPEWWAIQERVLEPTELWRVPLIGADPAPRLERTVLADVDAVIVSTDGARLDADRCEDLDSWLADGIQVGPVAPGYVSPHGDLGAARIELRRTR